MIRTTMENKLPKLRFHDEREDEYPPWTHTDFQNVCMINPSSKRTFPSCFIYIDLESVVQGRLIKRNLLSQEEAPSRAQRVLEPGDVLYQTVRPYQKNNFFFNFDGNYVASSGYAQLRSKGSSMFLYHLLHCQSFVNNVIAHCTGTSYPAISSNDLSKLKVHVPCLKEQQKIANFLSAIDEKIDKLTMKKSLLEQYKQGLKQKLFNEELRFKDESGREYPDWKKVRLSDIADVLRGSGLSKSALSPDGQYPCILYGELFTKYAETVQEVHSFTNVHSPVIGKYGDILMPTSDVTPDGLATASALLLNGVQLGGDINIIRLQPSNHPVFVAYMLNFFKHQIVRLVSGTTVKHIYPRDIRSLELVLPSAHEEQQRIADFLSAIDEKIELVNTQIEKTQTFKRGLLQQLFV